MKFNESIQLSLIPKEEINKLFKKLDEIEKKLESKSHIQSEVINGFISEKDAMKMIGRKQTWFWKLRNDGVLPYHKVGNKVFYRKEDLNRLFDKSK